MEKARLISKVKVVDIEEVKKVIISKEEREIDLVEKKEARPIIIRVEEETVSIWGDEESNEWEEGGGEV